MGIEIAGFDLLIEYAHRISGTAPITAEARIVQAIKDFNLHFDAEMKLIAANNHVTVGGKNYYPSLVLPSDQLIYYGRCGRFWLRTNACAPDQTNTQKSPCLFTTPYLALTYPFFAKGLPYRDPFVKTFSFAQLDKWTIPSVPDWGGLIIDAGPYRATNPKGTPGDWLNLNGFQLKALRDSRFTNGFFPFQLAGGNEKQVTVDLFGYGGLTMNINPFVNFPVAGIYPYAMLVPETAEFNPDPQYAEDPETLPVPTTPTPTPTPTSRPTPTP